MALHLLRGFKYEVKHGLITHKTPRGVSSIRHFFPEQRSQKMRREISELKP
jgi:hypothetical protein